MVVGVGGAALIGWVGAGGCGCFGGGLTAMGV